MEEAGKRGLIPLNARMKSKKRAAYLLFYSLLVVFFALPGAYSAGYISFNTFNFFESAVLSLLFTSGSVAYLFYRGLTPKKAKASLGIDRKSFSARMIGIGIALFIIVLLLELSIGIISSITGIPISTNVNMVFGAAPLWFLIFAVVVAPINEEIFFRGLLVTRIGILPSAVLFGILHASYNSTFGVEIIAAFIFGLLAGYVFKRTKSLYPSIAAHMLVNALALVVTFAI